jgi:hypothetical protein
MSVLIEKSEKIRKWKNEIPIIFMKQRFVLMLSRDVIKLQNIKGDSPAREHNYCLKEYVIEIMTWKFVYI